MHLKRLLFLVKVEGFSCWPYLKPGTRYLATSLSKPKQGDFVIFRDETESRFLVKKVVGKEKKGYRVASTLPLAQMNENLAPVPSELIEGKLLGIARDSVLN